MDRYNLDSDGVHVYEDDGKIYIEDAQTKIEWFGDFDSACAEAERLIEEWKSGR